MTEPFSTALLRATLSDIADEMVTVTSPKDFDGLWGQFDTAAQQLYDALAAPPIEVIDQPDDPPPPVERIGPPRSAPPDFVWLHNFDSLTAAPYEGLRVIREIANTIRWTVYIPTIAKPDRPLDWSRTDADMEVFVKLGFDVCPSAGTWLPRHWTNGAPTHEPYACTVNGGSQFSTEKPYCVPGGFGRIEPARVHDFFAAFAERYAKHCKYISTINEGDEKIYWPELQLDPTGYVGVKLCLRDLVVPAFDGWMSVAPNTIRVGPDTAYPGGLDLYLKAENEFGRRLWDVLAFHGYSEVNDDLPGAIEQSLLRILDALGVIKSNSMAPERPLWLTEYASKYDAPIVEWTRRIINAFPEIGGVGPYRCGQWIATESADPNRKGDAEWDAGKFVRNRKHADYVKLIEDVKRRRRAVRS